MSISGPGTPALTSSSCCVNLLCLLCVCLSICCFVRVRNVHRLVTKVLGFFKIFISPFNTFSLEHLWTVLVSLFLGDILSKEPQGAGFTLIYLTSIIKCDPF